MPRVTLSRFSIVFAINSNQRRLLEEARIYCVLAHLQYADLPGVLVTWIQQDIERFRNHCGRHPQQRRSSGLKPPIPGRTCEIGSFEPVSRKIPYHFDI